MYHFAKQERENNLIALGIFACIWLLTPAFGQVMLWLDGACNYLWSLFFNLLFILPFVRLFLNGRKTHLGGGNTTATNLFSGHRCDVGKRFLGIYLYGRSFLAGGKIYPS